MIKKDAMKKNLLLILLCISVSVTAQCWKSVSTGADFCVAIKPDGRIYAWGHNESGQLGIGTFDNKMVPTQVGEDSDWNAVTAGSGFVVALKTNGTLWVWGRNDFGLGGGSGTTSNIPLQVGTDADWRFVNAGGAHSLAIKTNGTLWGWGRNSFGQLGNGTFTNTNVPVQVGTATNWKTVSTGTFHSLAVKSDNTLWSWGYNFSGQLGNGTAGFGTELNMPAQIMGIVVNEWKCIDAGGSHSLAITEEGRLWVWGKNSNYALGINDGSTYKSLPTLISSATDWKIASGGINHTLAIKENNTLWGWGENISGQLGDGSVLNRVAPVQIGTATDWTFIDGGEQYSAFLKGGSLLSTGSNMYGQLGLGNAVSHNTPQTVTCPILNVKDYSEMPFVIYPNPVTEILHLQNSKNIEIDAIQIVDLAGKILMKNSENVSSINVQQLQHGMYLLQIYCGGEKFDFKFVKS